MRRIYNLHLIAQIDDGAVVGNAVSDSTGRVIMIVIILVFG